jgi:hypothetical protein
LDLRGSDRSTAVVSPSSANARLCYTRLKGQSRDGRVHGINPIAGWHPRMVTLVGRICEIAN